MDPSKKPDPYSLDASAPSLSGGGGGRFTTEMRNGVHIVTFSQKEVLDAFEIEQLSGELKRFVDGLDSPRVVINLEPVNHLSSAALGMLIATKTSVSGKGGGVCLANVASDLKQIFHLTNLDKLLEIHETTDAAVESLK